MIDWNNMMKLNYILIVKILMIVMMVIRITMNVSLNLRDFFSFLCSIPSLVVSIHLIHKRTQIHSQEFSVAQTQAHYITTGLRIQWLLQVSCASLAQEFASHASYTILQKHKHKHTYTHTDAHTIPYHMCVCPVLNIEK